MIATKKAQGNSVVRAKAQEMERKATAYGDLSSLDYAFELADDITDFKLRQLYESIVHRMRTESAHIPLFTLQQLEIERIAKYYIRLVEWERSDKFNMKEYSRYNDHFMRMVAQFSAKLMNVGPSQQHSAFLERVALVIAGILKTVDDEQVRFDIFQKFMFAFKQEGLS